MVWRAQTKLSHLADTPRSGARIGDAKLRTALVVDGDEETEVTIHELNFVSEVAQAVLVYALCDAWVFRAVVFHERCDKTQMLVPARGESCGRWIQGPA